MSSAISIPSTAAARTPSVATSTPAPVSVPIAPTAPISVSSTAIVTLAPRLPMFRLDLPTAEFGRGHKEPQVGVVGSELPSFRALVPRAVEFPVPELERPSADRTEGLHDPKIPLRRRELDRRLDLDHLAADDVPEAKHVANVIGVLFRYVRDVDRPLRFARELARRTLDRRGRLWRHHVSNIVHDAVHDVPDFELRGRVERPHPRDAVCRVED